MSTSSHDPGCLGRSKAGTGGSGHKASALVWAQGAGGSGQQGGPSRVGTPQTARGSGAVYLEAREAVHFHFSPKKPCQRRFQERPFFPEYIFFVFSELLEFKK